MNFDKEEALKDIDEVMARDSVGGTSGSTSKVVSYLNCIKKYAPRGSAHRDKAEAVDLFPEKRKADPIRYMSGIIHSLRKDIEEEKGFDQYDENIHASLFKDFLGQAEFLNKGGLTRASMLVAEITLEEHLRKLAAKNNVPVKKQNGDWRKASALNQDLLDEGVYPGPQRTQVQTWLELRNDAAHPGEDFENQHQQSEIGQHIEGIRDFISRLPA